MNSKWVYNAIAALTIFILHPVCATAQGISMEDEYAKFFARTQTITPISSFGDQVNLRDGGLSFRQIDFELKGTGPTIRLVRNLQVIGRVGGVYYDSSGTTVGEWDIAIPRIKTITSNKTTGVTPLSPKGWQVNGVPADARCTQMSEPMEVVPVKLDTDPMLPEAWWSGYQFADEFGNESTVLGKLSSPGEASYVARTKGNWIFSCLSSTANGMPGEAFLATSPDGTRYWLNYLIYRTAPGLNGAGSSSLPRNYASMLVTRIEDRFGNWLNYSYTDGALSSITASDGRQVTVFRSTDFTEISAISSEGAKKWRYNFSDRALVSLTLPDGSSWGYSLANIFSMGVPRQNSGNCGTLFNTGLSGDVRSGSITSPAGATSTYDVRILHIGRSYAPQSCTIIFPSDVIIAQYPKDSWSYAITSRTVTGPGLDAGTWNYSYSAGNSSWSDDCANGCISTVWTDVIQPDGVRHRSTFSNKYGGDEGLLLKEETFAAGSDLPSSVMEYSYAILPPAEQNSPFPWRSVGVDFTPRVNWLISERWTPIQSTRLTRDATIYRRAVNEFDSMARPVIETISSTPVP